MTTPNPHFCGTRTGDQLDDVILQCSNCFKRVAQPLLLKCLHTICGDGSHEKKCFRCEINIIQSLPGAIEEINNKFTENLIKFTGTEEFNCDECDEEEGDPATHKCMSCLLFLCKVHHNSHLKSKYTKKHEQLGISDLRTIKNSKSKPLCNVGLIGIFQEHNNEQLKFYCSSKNCEKTICVECALVSHRSHDFVEISKAFLPPKKDLEKKSKELSEFLLKFDEEKTRINSNKIKLLEACSDTRKKLAEFYADLIEKIQLERDENLEKINNFQIENSNSLENEEKRIEKTRKQYEEVNYFVNKFLEGSGPLEILSQSNFISGSLALYLNFPF